MFDLQELSQWDEAERAATPIAETVAEDRSIRTLQRMIARDDQVQCPFGFTNEVHDGQA